MDMSVYSLITAIVFFNIGLVIVRVFRRNTGFLVQNSTAVLLLLALLSLIRAMFPLDLEHAFVLQSETVYASIVDVLHMPLGGKISVGGALLAAWLLGSLAFLCKSAYGLIREFWQVRKFQTTEDARIQEIADSCLPDQVTVLVSLDVAVPMVTGIRRAYVYVPPLALSDEEWRLVLRHEYQHFRGKDIYIKLFYLILEAVFWWNPVVRFFHRELENLLELRCDSAVTKAMTEKERVTYLEAILNVMKQVAWRDVKQLNGAASLVDVKRQGFMRQRFEVILNKAAVSRGKSVRNICIIVIVFVCSYFVVVQPGWYPTEEDYGGGEIVEVTKENAYIKLDKNGTYQLYVDGEYWFDVKEDELDTIDDTISYDKLDIVREE